MGEFKAAAERTAVILLHNVLLNTKDLSECFTSKRYLIHYIM